MSLAELTNPTSLAASKPADGLWTSRSPIFLPPSPFPGQRNVPITTRLSSLSLPRRGLGLCANERGDVYLYGGVEGGRSDELYYYSVTDNTVTPLQCRGTCPGRRYKHAMAVVGNMVAIHGGDFLEDDKDPALYLLDLVSRDWSRISKSGSAPGNLFGHAMAVIGTTIYIFGGLEAPSYTFSNKLWAFNLDTLHTLEPTWELIEPTSQTRPIARDDSALVSYHDRLILFGGGNGTRDSGIVWSFDTKSRRWSQLQCTGDIPPRRTRHTAAIIDDVMYIIGGYGHRLERALIEDVFALKISGTPTFNVTSETLVHEFIERQWFKLTNTNTTPIPRIDHASTCIGTKIFVFGGELGEAFEKRGIHILDANYVVNPGLHAPMRLTELDIKFRDMLNRAKLEGTSPEETEWSKRIQIISHILEHPSEMSSLAHFQRSDAQMMVDFLANELDSQDILQSNTDKRHILHFLSKLARSAQVFPKSTKLSDVQCILTTPENDEGGCGLIYKGVLGGQVVCVKAVRIVKSETKAGRLLRAQTRELVFLAHVSHPNVIPLYGAYLSDEEKPRTCIVSPWMENGDLATYLRKFPNTPKIPLACDITAGLDYLHGVGIIHADLKATNVLVSRSQRAMLADFGIATVLHTSVGTTTAGDFGGTTYWMAPELLLAFADARPPVPTKQSDMWGFACICYEMSTGEVPFAEHYSPIQLAMAFARGHGITPLRPNQGSGSSSINGEPWVPLAERCWSYDPSERPAAAEALQYLLKLDIYDGRPSMDEELATFKAVKESRVKVEIDYTRVLSIVQNR